MLLEDMFASCNGKCNPIRNFSADEIMRATKNFNPLHIIQKCKLVPMYRIKVVELDFLQDDNYKAYVMYRGSLDERPIIVKKFTGMAQKDEIRSLAIHDIVITTQMSNHKNVLKLLGCCLEFYVPVLVLEDASNGALNDKGGFGADDESLPWKIRMRIAKELANALTYLHTALSSPVVHSDIRPDSIFLDNNLVPPKFSNFSQSP